MMNSPEEIKFDVPFPMPAALHEDIRHGHMAICVNQKIPKMWPVPIDGEKVLSIACYGPSLKTTWKDLKRPIVSMSGSHNFLIKRGVVPDYHIDMDPRSHKLSHILNPHKDVQYLMASVCHPFTWSILKNYNLKIWHVVSGKGTREWLEKYDPRTLLVAGGSSIGLASIHVGGCLGYRRFEIFGMDGCFEEGKETRHAGVHYGHEHKQIEWTAGDRVWKTSKIMMNSNIELLNMLRHFPFFAVLHGYGLQQALVEESGLSNAAVHGTEKADLVRTAEFDFIYKEAASG
jgi:hypothetical protein